MGKSLLLQLFHEALGPLGNEDEIDLAVALALKKSGRDKLPDSHSELKAFLQGPLVTSLQEFFDHFAVPPAVNHLLSKIEKHFAAGGAAPNQGPKGDAAAAEPLAEEPSSVRKLAGEDTGQRRRRRRRTSGAIREDSAGGYKDFSENRDVGRTTAQVVVPENLLESARGSERPTVDLGNADVQDIDMPTGSLRRTNPGVRSAPAVLVLTKDADTSMRLRSGLMGKAELAVFQNADELLTAAGKLEGQVPIIVFDGRTDTMRAAAEEAEAWAPAEYKIVMWGVAVKDDVENRYGCGAEAEAEDVAALLQGLVAKG